MAKVEVAAHNTVARSDRQVGTELDGLVVLMNIDAGRYYQLNAIASAIWARIEIPRTVSDLCADLEAEFDADRDTIDNDVRQLLSRLAAENVVTIT